MPDLTYPGPDTIRRHVLDNGIIVLAYENYAAESVVVEGFLRAGALSDPADRAGLADFVAGMLMRGTSRRSFDDIYEQLESIGASLDFSAGRHVTEFGASSLAEDLETILELLADALTEPSFPESELEQLRGEIMTGLQIRASDTRQMASLNFRELLYEGHPYGRSVRGYLETVPNITRHDVRDYHERCYGPHGMAVTIVGAIEAEKAIALVDKALGHWHNSDWDAPPEVPPAARPLLPLQEYVAIPDKSQCDIVLGLPGPSRSEPDYLDASLANTILGVFGMMGRLGKSVREEQGLAYYVYSRLQGGLGPAPWYVATGVAPENVEAAIKSIRFEIDRIRDELVEEEELDDNKLYRIGSLPVSLETNGGMASAISDIELLDLGLDFLQRFPDLIAEITAERVQRAARKYFSAEQVVISVSGPPGPSGS